MIKRWLYNSFRLVYGIKYWMGRRFTRAGFPVLGGLAVSALIGLDTNQTVAYQAFTFLASLLVLSIFSSLFFRARFEARRKLPPYGTVNQPLAYHVVIQNRAPKRQEGLFLLEEVADPRPAFEEFLKTREPWEKRRNPFDRAIGYHRWLWLISREERARFREQPVPVLPPGGKEEVRVEVLPLRRGPLRFRGLTVARPDPFGLFRACKNFPCPQEVLILPRQYPLPPIQMPGTRVYQPGGVAMASSIGDSEEFTSMRDYRPGDPPRRIHWKSWAKTGRPIVKEYQNEFFVRHALVLDTFQESEESEIFEEAVSVAASFACSIHTHDSLLDLMFVGTEAYCFTSGRGIAQTGKMLEILAAVRVCQDRPFHVLPPLVLERASLLSGCVCIFLAWDDERKTFIRRLEAMGIPVLALVVTEADAPHPVDVDQKAGPEKLHFLQKGKIEEGLARL
ncbi:MAG: DUF58 domain-containing protein [Pseudomonadota bacterium]